MFLTITERFVEATLRASLGQNNMWHLLLMLRICKESRHTCKQLTFCVSVFSSKSSKSYNLRQGQVSKSNKNRSVENSLENRKSTFESSCRYPVSLRPRCRRFRAWTKPSHGTFSPPRSSRARIENLYDMLFSGIDPESECVASSFIGAPIGLADKPSRTDINVVFAVRNRVIELRRGDRSDADEWIRLGPQGHKNGWREPPLSQGIDPSCGKFVASSA